MRSTQNKIKKSNSPIMQKITSFFKRDNKETGHISVRPACFADAPERLRSESPEPAGANAQKKKNATTAVSGGKDGSGVGWRPKGRLEWELDSGRQVTVGDVPVNELSKVEIYTMQRLGISILQSMDIPVSHGLLKGSRNVFQRMSYNTFRQRRVNSSDKPMEGFPGVALPNTGIFGQPLDQVVSQDQPPSKSGSGTPIHIIPTILTQRSLHYPPSISPTSTSSSEVSFMIEPTLQRDMNTTMLLDTLNINPSHQSPKSKRRMSLCPTEPQVPSIVTKAISYLETKGVKTEGLFRISGSKSRISEIREKFDSGEDVELTNDVNPHDVACLLKEFFRSLPEPLMTVELFGPFISTRKLSNPGQRRDSLRLLCLLLPQANRDTLQELLQFLSRVALHSDGIILIDGTEEVGNRMTEQNLAMILGPNILHREVKRKSQKQTDFQVQKLDAEELASVCKVMEDLIRMQISIFTIPAQLYSTCLKSMLKTDPTAVDLLLKRRCYEQGLFPEDSPSTGLVPRSYSTDALHHKISINSCDMLLSLDQDLTWLRTHSQTDVQQDLDEALRNLEFITEDLESLHHHQHHYSSTDSAMGGSEMVVSPVQSDFYSEPSTLNKKQLVFHSTDSAFSNNSSPTNSNDGAVEHHSHSHSELSSDYICNHHIRMLSEASNTSSGSQPPPALKVTVKYVPASTTLQPLSSGEDKNSTLLPGLCQHSQADKHYSSLTLPTHSSLTLPTHSSTIVNTSNTFTSSSKDSEKSTQLLPDSIVTPRLEGRCAHNCFPNNSSNHLRSYSETTMDSFFSNLTTAESAVHSTSSPSGFSLHSKVDKSTVI